MIKIIVKSCTQKVKNEKYTIYEIVDTDDKKYDCNGEFKFGDVIECEIIPDATGKGYNPKLKIIKPNNNKAFVVKDTKRETALLAASNSRSSNQSTQDIIDRADKFYEWLNKK